MATNATSPPGAPLSAAAPLTSSPPATLASKPPAAPPRPLVAYGLMAAVCLVWSSTWLVIKVGLRDLPPLTSAGIRIVLAGLLMAALAPWLVPREGGGRPPWLVIIAQGLSQFAFNYGLVYYAETLLPSGLVSVLWSAFPLMIALAGHFLTRQERLARVQWLGCVVAFFGVVVLFATDISNVSRKAVGAALLVLLAPASVAVSTLLIKQRAPGSSSVLLNRDSMLLGGGVLAVSALLLESDAPQRWTWVAVGSVAYLTLFGTVFTFGVYIWLLRYLPAYLLSLTSYVVPVLALLFAAAFGGEPLTLTTAIGTLLVLGGVALTKNVRLAR